MQFVAAKAKIWWNNRGSSFFSETRFIVLHASQFGFEASASELRLRLDRVEAELSVEKKKCLMLRREMLMDKPDKVAGDVCDKRSLHVQMAELQVMFR